MNPAAGPATKRGRLPVAAQRCLAPPHGVESASSNAPRSDSQTATRGTHDWFVCAICTTLMVMEIEIEQSARKHGCADDEIRHAVLHSIGHEQIEGYGDEMTVVFVGQPHPGALPDNLLEVIVSKWQDGQLHAFHAMPLTSRWQHLRYQ